MRTEMFLHLNHVTILSPSIVHPTPSRICPHIFSNCPFAPYLRFPNAMQHCLRTATPVGSKGRRCSLLRAPTSHGARHDRQCWWCPGQMWQPGQCSECFMLQRSWCSKAGLEACCGGCWGGVLPGPGRLRRLALSPSCVAAHRLGAAGRANPLWLNCCKTLFINLPVLFR